jgi:cation transport protein ChaC
VSARPDPFRHLPQLRERIAPADDSPLRITPELLARWDERAREQGRGPDWRLSDAQLEATRIALLGDGSDGRDLWVFGYGSLTWDPGFHFDEVRMARLPGYRRRFGCRTVVGRGSPDCPGLMLTLEPGDGDCEGLAFRIAADSAAQESGMVWRREMIRAIYRPCLLAVHTPQGPVQALVFAANAEHADHVHELPLQDAARMIARAEGVLGSNRQYLEQLVQQLAHLGIADPYLEQLLEQVRGCVP